VEVDAHYIEGMLTNPDIQPSASINCWILSILTFHFTLVHVKGTLHGPDGLLQHPLQHGDLEEEEDDFEDWVNCLYGFLHVVHNLFPSYATPPIIPPHQPLIVTLTNAQILSGENSNNYSEIPQTKKGKDEDDKLAAVRTWHKDLIHPEGISNSAYKWFLQYVTLFFPDYDRLWKKDAHGAHKLVIYPKDHL